MSMECGQHTTSSCTGLCGLIWPRRLQHRPSTASPAIICNCHRTSSFRPGSSPTSTCTSWDSPQVSKFSFLVTVIKQMTRWVELLPLKSTSTVACTYALFQGVNCPLHVPTVLTSDRGHSPLLPSEQSSKAAQHPPYCHHRLPSGEQ
jgi:hypothetical protein